MYQSSAGNIQLSKKDADPYNNGDEYTNRIINGNFSVNQTGTTSLVIPNTANPIRITDRWFLSRSLNASLVLTATIDNDTTVASGSGKCLTMTHTGTVVGGTLNCQLYQAIEQSMVSDFNLGYTASQTPFVVSFYLKTNMTGYLSSTILNGTLNRSYTHQINVDGSGNWVFYSFVVQVGVLSPQLILNNTGMVFCLNYNKGNTTASLGQVDSWVSGQKTGLVLQSALTEGDYYVSISDIQITKGSSLLPWNYRNAQTELMLARRYYRLINIHLGYASTPQVLYSGNYQMVQEQMRDVPVLDTGYANAFTVSAGLAGTVAIPTTAGAISSTDGITFYNSANNWTAGSRVSVQCALTAELTI